MEQIKRCIRCIVPESLPSAEIDNQGVCRLCKQLDRVLALAKNQADKKRTELDKIMLRAKKFGKPYDCLIPLSGGKDSTYVLYLCSKVYDLKCLCVTFDNGYLSDHAKENIRNSIKLTSADHIYYTANPRVLSKLYGLFLKKTGNFCSACMRGIEVAIQIACTNFRPPLLISGGGAKVTYAGIYPEIFEGGDVRFFQNVVRGEPVGTMVRPFLSPWTSRQINKGARELFRAFKLQDRMLGHYTYFMNIYDYIDASFVKIKHIIENEMGWTSPEGSFEHMDCLLHDIPAYIHTIKFPELTPTTLYNSHQVRLGFMQREEALKIEEENLRNQQEPRGLDKFLLDIGMSREEFYTSVNDWKKMSRFRAKGNEALRALYRWIASR